MFFSSIVLLLYCLLCYQLCYQLWWSKGLRKKSFKRFTRYSVNWFVIVKTFSHGQGHTFHVQHGLPQFSNKYNLHMSNYINFTRIMLAVRMRKVDRIILWCPHIFKETRSVATVKQFRKWTCDDAIRLNPVYTIQPVWQQVVSCKRGFTV